VAAGATSTLPGAKGNQEVRVADDQYEDGAGDEAGEESFPASDPPAGPASLPTRESHEQREREAEKTRHEHALGDEASTS
jgi:hypothetical protein